MLSETVFNSEDLPAADRFEAWRAVMSRTHAPMDLSSDHEGDYRAHLRLITLGEVSVWPATYQQLVFHRTPKLIRQSDPEAFHLTIILRGEGGVSWGRHDASYQQYDFHTNDSSRPWEVWTGRDLLTTVGVEIPKTLLPLPRSAAERAVGLPMSAHEGIGSLLGPFLTRLAAGTGTYKPADGPRLGVVLADLVGALFAHAVDADSHLPEQTRHRTLMLHIKAFVRQRIGDHDLTPDAIAAAHHISRSSLYRLFKAEGTTVAAHIRHQRLEGARADLANPILSTTPIHAIAARWGFPRPADFSRAFRATYGTTAQDHRYHATHLPNPTIPLPRQHPSRLRPCPPPRCSPLTLPDNEAATVR